MKFPEKNKGQNLAFLLGRCYNPIRSQFGALAQLGERKVRNLEARGSIPLRSTIQTVEISTVF